MYLSVQALAGHLGGMSRGLTSGQSEKSTAVNFASLINIQPGDSSDTKSTLSPPASGDNSGLKIGQSDISTPVGKPADLPQIGTLIGNFIGNASMLADLVPIVGAGTDDDIEAQGNYAPDAPPTSGEAGDASSEITANSEVAA